VGAAVGAWRCTWPLWLRWGRGRFPGPQLLVMGAWLVPWDPCGLRGGEAGPRRPVWLPWRRGGPLHFVRSLWGRDRSNGPRVATLGALAVCWVPRGTRRSWPVPWASRGCRAGVATLGAWPIPWAPCCCRGCVAGPISPTWQLWEHGRSYKTRVVAVGAGLIPWSSRVRRGNRTGPLGPLWPL